ncbi:hypothetical protein M426DRAFT_8082 [Hypoxylon sp. CI-4A]|nr:hypothetical protein M426DRAFT_8082 [Hypoxylon sp. CI-4A]
MYSKTAALGLIAVTGVMAGDNNAAGYPTYAASSVAYSSSSSSVEYATSAPSAPYHTSKAYPVNGTAVGTAPTAVWQYYNTSIPTTVVVPEYTTFCPEATTLTYNKVPYTATKGQTITVTNCPCTISTHVNTVTSSLCPPGVTPTAVAPAIPGATYPGAPNLPVPGPSTTTGATLPVAGTYPAGVPPAANTPAPNAPGNPNSPSVSAAYPAQPTGVQIAGASGNAPGLALALFAAIMGALAL